MDKNEKDQLLLVDDSDENLDILVEILSDNYELSVATDGITALEAAGDSPPDLILLDIMMPGMDGYEVCRKLKTMQTTAEIPVIFVTAKNEIEDEAMGFEIGCVDYITKPIVPSIVQARVKTHLELNKMRKHLQQKNRQLLETAKLREEVESITRHDLKNPLSGIFTGIDYLLRIGEIDDDQRTTLELMSQSAHKMLGMINSSLDLFKMEQGLYRLHPEPVDVFPLIRGVTHELRDSIKRKRLAVNVSFNSEPVSLTSTCRLKGEQLLCYSMLANLILNAIEASPPESSVEITILQSDKQVIIKIKNDSAVPEKIRPVFFDKFVTDGKKRGTGLGTYSAKLMVETMNGQISMQSGIDDTTSIAITLPA